MLAQLCLTLFFLHPLRAPRTATSAPDSQQLVDAIVVQIGDDVITLSELRDLAAYQQLVDGKSNSNEKLISELIEQWIVNNEASTAHFPEAAAADVSRETARIESRFPSPQAYRQRLSELGITPDTVHRIVAQQIYLARYLDYKFRPSIQVDDASIEKYYRETLVPALSAKNQSTPPLSQVAEQIREVLTAQGIDERAAAWFEQMKSQLKIEIKPLPQTGANQSQGERIEINRSLARI